MFHEITNKPVDRRKGITASKEAHFGSVRKASKYNKIKRARRRETFFQKRREDVKVFKCENDAQEEGNQLLMIFRRFFNCTEKGRKSTMSMVEWGPVRPARSPRAIKVIHFKFYFQFARKRKRRKKLSWLYWRSLRCAMRFINLNTDRRPTDDTVVPSWNSIAAAMMEAAAAVDPMSISIFYLAANDDIIERE